MKDITRHNITEYFSDLYAIKHDPHQTEAIRNSAKAKLYVLSIVSLLHSRVGLRDELPHLPMEETQRALQT